MKMPQSGQGMAVWSWSRDLPNSARHVRVFTARLSNTGLADLARTPLVASMLCQLHAADPSRYLPEGRAGAYQSFVELLYEQNTHKSIRNTHDEVIRVLKDRHQIPRDQRAAEQTAQLVRDDLPGLIDHLAHERINGNTAPVVEILARHLDVQRPAKVKAPLWNAFLGDLLRPTGLLYERSGDFHFLHQTLLEYHAARHATRDEQARAELLQSLFRRDHAFADGHASAPDVESSYLGFLLDGLLAPADHIAAETLQALDDLTSRNAIAACRLLATLVKLRTNLPADRTAHQLAKLALRQDLAGWRLVAAKYLVGVDGHWEEGAGLLARLVDDTTLSFKNRVKAAWTLAQLRGHRPEAAGLLLRLAGDKSLGYPRRLDAGWALSQMKECREGVVRLFAPYAYNTWNHHHDRRDAAGLLAAFGEERAIETLFREATEGTFGTSDIRNRARAALYLTALGDERLAGPLAAMTEYDPEGDILGHALAAKALSQLPRHREEAAEVLARIASDPAVWAGPYRVEAAEYLAELDGYRGKAVELLTLLAENNISRNRADQALAKLGAPRHSTVGKR
ncbi:hypothetical protein [Streptomyces sp. NPDC059991]|uniref:hypothetical protein n=1 Tax=unclassified Streptomyces TaxID=2593676 RepID=UPI003691E49F